MTHREIAIRSRTTERYVRQVVAASHVDTRSIRAAAGAPRNTTLKLPFVE